MVVYLHQLSHLLSRGDLAALLILMVKTGQASQNYSLLALLVVEVEGHLLQETLVTEVTEEPMEEEEVGVEPRLITLAMAETAELVEMESLS
jgi:hypothetical protein